MDIPEYLASGEIARLIPVAADSSREGRAASVLLATLSAVPDLARTLLTGLGIRVGARSHLDCYTEVVFKQHTANGGTGRPDGLIVLLGGQGRSWRCLIEAKIGKAEIEPEQITRYLALAKANGIDAVLSISNQFVPLATHSPVKIPKTATRGVDLFHWSWMHVVTEATLLLNDGAFESAAQKYVLSEMVRYFTHPSIGVSTFDRMNSDWKDVVQKVQTGAPLLKTSVEIENSVAAWHQESRDLALLMSRKLNRKVHCRLHRQHADDPALWLRADADSLAADHELRCVLEVPDAAAPITVIANLQRRSLTVSMNVAAPKDRQRSSSRINWLIRQLSKADPTGAFVKANWPGRSPATQAPLSEVRTNPAALDAPNPAIAPVSFDVMLVRDLAGRFAGAKTFIEEVERAVPTFYEQLGQHLRNYVPTPPKLIKTENAPEQGKSAAEPMQILATAAGPEHIVIQETPQMAPERAILPDGMPESISTDSAPVVRKPTSAKDRTATEHEVPEAERDETA